MSGILKQFGEHLFFWSYTYMTKSSLYNTILQYEYLDFRIKKQLTATFFRSLTINVSRNLGTDDFNFLLLDKILMNHPDFT